MVIIPSSDSAKYNERSALIVIGVNKKSTRSQNFLRIQRISLVGTCDEYSEVDQGQRNPDTIQIRCCYHPVPVGKYVFSHRPSVNNNSQKGEMGGHP